MTLKLLQAVTSVRVGDGSAVSAINLPLARERHTRWPFIPGSSLKGALRIRARMQHGSTDAIARVFGSEPEADEDDASVGTLGVGPCTLLALPVRSLTATFALLTCPTALARFGRAAGESPSLTSPQIEDALTARSDRIERPPGVGSDAIGVVTLEDLDLAGSMHGDVSAWVDFLRRHCSEGGHLDALTVVHDDVFAHACRAWTERRTRNAIGQDGVVDEHALFTVEALPAETLLWTRLAGDDGGLLPDDGETFVLGGHQSVGLGRVAWYGGAP